MLYINSYNHIYTSSWNMEKIIINLKTDHQNTDIYLMKSLIIILILN